MVKKAMSIFLMLQLLCNISFGCKDVISIGNSLTDSAFDEKQCNKIVTQILNGQLKPGNRGRIVLPKQLASATRNGKVYVTNQASGNILILFLTWQGRHQDLGGYLYSAKSLDHLVNQELTIIGPCGGGASPVQVEIMKKRKKNWYYVSRRLD